MSKTPNPFRWFESSPEVIRLAVMMYVRYPLSLRNVEDLLFERGIDICHETVRLWWNRFGPMGMGLSVDHPGRLLAIRDRLETVHDDEGQPWNWRSRRQAATKPMSATSRGSCRTTAPVTSPATWSNG
jgi:hypothetical protein